MDNSPFQRLPAELRNHIWELALHHQEPIQLTGGSHTRQKVVAPKQLHRFRCLALLETCRALYTECRSIFYFVNTFKVYSHQPQASAQTLLDNFQLQLRKSVKLGNVLLVTGSHSYDAELEDVVARLLPAFREAWALLRKYDVGDAEVKFEYTVRLGQEQWQTAKKITWFEEVVWDAKNICDAADLRTALDKLLH